MTHDPVQTTELRRLVGHAGWDDDARSGQTALSPPTLMTPSQEPADDTPGVICLEVSNRGKRCTSARQGVRQF